MNVKISLTYLLHYLSYSYSVEANILEQQQATAIFGSMLAGFKYFFERICAKIFRTASSKIKGTGQTEIGKHVQMSTHNSIFTNSLLTHNLIID